MTRLVLATLACSLVACSQDADIGIDTQPVTCTDVGTAVVDGTVRDPFSGTTFDFGTTTARVGGAQTENPAAVLEDGTLQLQFNFVCGRPDRVTYDVGLGANQDLDCPLEISSSVGGQIEYLPAASGTVIVDETSNCLAGRFALDFGAHGALAGSFRAPWQ